MDYAYAKWTQEWQLCPLAQHSKNFYLSPNKIKARYVYKLARLELGRFIRIITGHNNLNYFQTRIGLWGSPECRLCGENKETFLHFLYECPRVRANRTDVFSDSLPQADMQWSVQKLLQFSYLPAIDLAFEGTWAHSDPPGSYQFTSDDESEYEDESPPPLSPIAEESD